jgi:hypothetical protein
VIDTAARDVFQLRCERAARTLAGCVGYFVERVSFGVLAQEDSLEIALQGGPSQPDIIVQLTGVLHVSLTKPGELSGCFVDAISLTHLPSLPLPWPDGAAGRVHRFEGLHELAWLQLDGPMAVDVVASTVTVYSAESTTAA